MYRSIVRLFATLSFLLSSTPLWAQLTFVFENPADTATVSGISLISGWKCTAGPLTVGFDGNTTTTYQVAYGTIREDTLANCGDTNNGFGFLFNWGRLSNGPHTVQLYENGAEIANIAVTVTRYGVEFLTGVTNSTLVADFPTAGKTATLTWQEGQQNFVVSEVTSLSPPASGEFSATGAITLSNCTSPNNGTLQYNTTLVVSPASHPSDGFFANTNPITFSPSLSGTLNFMGNVDEGFIQGGMQASGEGSTIDLNGTFKSANPVTEAGFTISYVGLARIDGATGICQFEGTLNAIRNNP